MTKYTRIKTTDDDQDEKSGLPIEKKSWFSSLSERPEVILVQANMGVILALCSCLLLSFYSVVYRTMKDDMARPTVLIIRGLVQSASCFLMYCLFVTNPSENNNSGTETENKDLESGATEKTASNEQSKSSRMKIYFILAIVALVGGLRLTMIFVGLQNIPMATVHTILNGSPILVMVMSHCMLSNDRFSKVKALACVLFVTGIIMTFQPFKLIKEVDMSLFIGLICSTGALIFSGTGSVLTKKISQDIDKFVISGLIGVSILFVGGLSGLADHNGLQMEVDAANANANLNASLSPELLEAFGNDTGLVRLAGSSADLSCVLEKMSVQGNLTDQIWASCPLKTVYDLYLPESFNVWGLAVAVALMGSGQQLCLIAAIKLDKPSRVTMVRSLQILISYLMQLSTTGEVPQVAEILGAATILTAILLVSLEQALVGIFSKNAKCKVGTDDKAL